MLKAGIFTVLLISLFSCSHGGNTTYMNNVNSSWKKDVKQDFQFEINDSQNLKNIIFVVRNNDDYPFSNIRFIVNLESPNKKIETDTLNYVLAKPNGEWLGTGFGATKETLFQYKLDYKFPANGVYKIKIAQAMRRDILPGIEDLGIKIESAKP